MLTVPLTSYVLKPKSGGYRLDPVSRVSLIYFDRLLHGLVRGLSSSPVNVVQAARSVVCGEAYGVSWRVEDLATVRKFSFSWVARNLLVRHGRN